MMNKLPTEVLYILFAGIGGIAKYLSTYKKDNGKFVFGALIVASITSGFSGYMFALFALSIQLPESMVFMFAGMGGFMGEYSLRLLGEFITKKWFK